ncbi:MAG: peptidylprolyl isomerase, partial [Bacteroidota bacterium]
QTLGEDPGPEPAAEVPEIDWDYLRSLGPSPTMEFNTGRGSFVAVLDVESAPLTVQTMVRLAQVGRFDGTRFHRVVPNFVLQGGDVAFDVGFGGPGTTIVSEFTRTPYGTGTLGMASAGKDTEGSQFFVTHAPQPHLDGRYTVFGQVAAAQGIADRVAQGDLLRRLLITARP